MSVIVSYNINGVRAAIKKGLVDWARASQADVICLQEIKARPDQFDEKLFNEIGYHCFINSADKPGYSGVAILSKKTPNHVEFGCNIKQIDEEGRVIRADFDEFSVISIYFPSGSNPLRQSFKMRFLDLIFDYIVELKKKIPNLIISGDYNICHMPIDIHNPQTNKNSSGFLPEEREWMSKFIDCGFIDSFRHFNKEAHNYSWWSYRSAARLKNLGWRIDYNMISDSLISKIKRSSILNLAKHSDHCPVLIEIAD